MEFYFILFIILLIFLGFSYFDKRAGLVLLFVLFIVLAFRGADVGTDTERYINHYFSGYAKGDVFSVKHLEFIYIFLVNILTKLSFSSYSVIFTIALLTFVSLFIVIRKCNLNAGIFAFFYVLLGFYLYSFNWSRQMMAISILLIGYMFFVYNEVPKDRLYLFSFLLFAGMLHNSVLLFFPLVFTPRKTMSKITFILLLSLALAVFLSDFNLLFGNIKVILDTNYSNYAEFMNEYSSTSIYGKIYYLLILVFQLIILKVTYHDFNSKLVNLFMISLIFFFLIKNMHPFLSRLIYGISIIQVVYYTKFAADKKYSRTVKILIFLPLGILLLYNQYVVVDSNIGEIVPYTFNL